MENKMLDGLSFGKYIHLNSISLLNDKGDVLCTLPSRVKDILDLEGKALCTSDFKPYLGNLISSINEMFIRTLAEDLPSFEEEEDKKIVCKIVKRNMLIRTDLEVLECFDGVMGGWYGWPTAMINGSNCILFEGQKVYYNREETTGHIHPGTGRFID